MTEEKKVTNNLRSTCQQAAAKAGEMFGSPCGVMQIQKLPLVPLVELGGGWKPQLVPRQGQGLVRWGFPSLEQ